MSAMISCFLVEVLYCSLRRYPRWGYYKTFGDEVGIGMAAVLGKVEQYDPELEEWPQYVERLEYFFEANGITDAEKKRSVFLSVVGPSPFKLLRNLVSPAKLSEKTFVQLVTIR